MDMDEDILYLLIFFSVIFIIVSGCVFGYCYGKNKDVELEKYKLQYESSQNKEVINND